VQSPCRYEVGSKGEKRYSILANKDRKKELKDIPDSAFPAPAAMPTIPDATDGVAMEPPPDTNLPKEKPATAGDKTKEDLPK